MIEGTIVIVYTSGKERRFPGVPESSYNLVRMDWINHRETSDVGTATVSLKGVDMVKFEPDFSDRYPYPGR